MENISAGKSLSLVVPFYNEERAVAHFFESVVPVMDALPGCAYEFVCVNDGSSDLTLQKLLAAKEKYGERVKIVDLSRNFGKEAALTAGIDFAAGDAVIPIDCDLQDPVELIPELIGKWEEGYEVVLAKRTDRSSDSYLKACTAGLFYRLFNTVSDTAIPENVGDFRLMSRNAVDALKRLPERRRFMKGLFAWIGFRQAVVEYSRKSRVSGRTKFTYPCSRGRGAAGRSFNSAFYFRSVRNIRKSGRKNGREIVASHVLPARRPGGDRAAGLVLYAILPALAAFPGGGRGVGAGIH